MAVGVALACAAGFAALYEWSRWLDSNSMPIIGGSMFTWKTWRTDKFSVGARVVDPIFGPGEVKRVRSDGAVFVRFDRNDGADLLMDPRVLEAEKERAS